MMVKIMYYSKIIKIMKMMMKNINNKSIMDIKIVEILLGYMLMDTFTLLEEMMILSNHQVIVFTL